MPRPRKSDRIQSQEPELCPEQVVHMDAVREVRAALPSPQLVAGVSDLFSALGDPTRLRIVAALNRRELCVCDLAATLGLSQSAVSHQLGTLRRLGLIRARPAGRLVYYALDDEHVATLYRQALDHASHQADDSQEDEGRRHREG